MNSESRLQALDPFSRSVADAAQTVGPAVAWIGRGGGRGVGSGVVWDTGGHIVTNAHVVGDARQVDVALASGQRFVGRTVGADALFDLAVVRIESAGAPDLTPARFGDSDNLSVGQGVIALGNPLGFSWTVTFGVVSALERTLAQRFEAARADLAAVRDENRRLREALARHLGERRATGPVRGGDV